MLGSLLSVSDLCFLSSALERPPFSFHPNQETRETSEGNGKNRATLGPEIVK